MDKVPQSRIHEDSTRAAPASAHQIHQGPRLTDVIHLIAPGAWVGAFAAVYLPSVSNLLLGLVAVPLGFTLMWQIRKLYWGGYQSIAAKNPSQGITAHQILLVDIASVVGANALYALVYFSLGRLLGSPT